MILFAATGLDRFNPAQGGVRGMRVVATGLLIAMAVIYLWLRVEHPQPHLFWSFVRAFAEAAMVGGLADWFAVTALFRHPLGIPIPHTAIIPRNKDRIGDTLALFLKDNFLTPSVVSRRMYGVDFAAAAGRFLASPPKSGRVQEGASRLIADIIDALADDRLGGMAKAAISLRLRALDLAPLLGQILETAMDAGRHLPLLDNVIQWSRRMLSANEGLIREMIHARAGTILRWTGFDETLANAILEGLDKLLAEIADNPEHPLRLKAEEALAALARDLRHDPAMKARVDRVRDELLTSPALVGWLDGLWQHARTALLRAVRNPDASHMGQFGEAIRTLGRTLQTDRRLATMINRFVRRATVGAIASYGDGIVTLVSETIRGWDAETVTGRLENAVGRDLQYIRINGTVVGGLVGVAIHAVDVLL
jgi:uncharacterized membrane-anchored protein YjiN (DUF445 family)